MRWSAAAAESLAGERDVEPWVEELEARWDRAMERFTERWVIGRG